MSDVMNLISEAGQAHKVIIDQSRKLAGKWEKSGLLEGLGGPDKQSMAVMLENQAAQLLQESSQTNPGGSSTAEQWSGVALPLVRKVFGSIASKNFVSVQPMNLPSGLVFYMDFKYGTTNGGQTSGQSLYGTTLSSPFTDTDFGNTDEGGLYGAGRFGYSINDTASADGLGIATGSVSLADVNFNSDYSASLSNYRKFTVPTSNLTSADLLAVRTFVPSGSVVDFAANVVPEFTAVSGSNVVFIVATTGNAVLNKVFYSKQPTATSRGDFEDRDGSTDLNIPQIDLELKSDTIVAKTRKLKAVWSPELAQDLHYNLN